MAVEQPVRRVATRIPWMDRLRVVTIAGVVVVHVATAYVVDIGWYYEERTTSTATADLLLLPTFVAAVFGLAPLFMVAGWLSEKSLSRETPGAFARSRLLRLGVPIVAYFALVDPLADYLGSSAEGGTRSLGAYLTDLGGDRDFGPVWFLVALLLFSLVLAASRSARPRPGASQRAGPVRVGTLAAVAGAVAVLDFLLWFRWTHTDTVFWNIQVAHWPQSAAVFVLGVLAFRRDWFATMPRPLARACGWTALGGAVALAVLIAVTAMSVDDPTSVIGGLHWQAVVFALLDGVTVVSVCIWVAYWMGRRWNGPLAPWLGKASRGSYAAYLLHPVVLVGLSALARPVPWVPEVKFVVVSVVGVPACFLVGYLVTRLPGVRAVV